MTVEQVVPELMVRDVEATLQFYVRVLGFRLLEGEFDDDERLVWAKARLGGFILAFKDVEVVRRELPDLHDVEPGSTACLCLTVHDVDVYYPMLEEVVTVLRSPVDTEYGTRRMVVQDPDGTVLMIESVSDEDDLEELPLDN